MLNGSCANEDAQKPDLRSGPQTMHPNRGQHLEVASESMVVTPSERNHKILNTIY